MSCYKLFGTGSPSPTDNGAEKPSQSASLTALPEGEPRDEAFAELQFLRGSVCFSLHTFPAALARCVPYLLFVILKQRAVPVNRYGHDFFDLFAQKNLLIERARGLAPCTHSPLLCCAAFLHSFSSSQNKEPYRQAGTALRFGRKERIYRSRKVAN